MPKKTSKANTSKVENKKRRNERFSRLRGMRDILFEEYRYYELLEKKAADLARTYGFKRIDTPVLERQELYEKATGDDTDIVIKEMYNFTDKSGEKVAMRPEATPSLVRAYIEHGMFNQPQPVKMFWLGSAFRHDKPQSGRYRQFTQFDLEMFGEDSPVADAQLVTVAYNFFRELQLDVQIQINSLGDRESRENYLKELKEFYMGRGKRSKLCTDCKRRFQKNLLRLLDCKEPDCVEVREGAPQIVDSLNDECREHFIKVLEYLDELDIPYNLNPFLVRGLDYYNKTVFEVTAASEDEEEAKRQAALGGGGRYDGLVEHMGGRETPALGFAIGLERVILKIKEKNIPLKGDDGAIVFLGQLGDQARRRMFVLFEEMRRSGYKVRQAFTKDSLKQQLEEADRLGAKWSLILGQKEMLDGTIIIRDMESGTQEVVDYKKIYPELNKRLEEGKESQEVVASVPEEEEKK